MSRLLSATASATVLLLASAAAASAGSRPSGEAAFAFTDQERHGPLIDVPYLPQSENLCGGAAVAMVMRYWGERQVFPEDFEALVDRSTAGIATDVLASDVRRRGWQAFPVDAQAGAGRSWVREHLDRGHPIVALLAVGPNRYHYVVVVSWTRTHLIVHDPARAPFRVMTPAEFEAGWAPAGNWALLILPGDGRLATPSTPAGRRTAAAGPSPRPCAPLVAEMVERARSGDIASADDGLTAAVRICPHEASAWRELAGVRFLQSRWSEASAFAERAQALEPEDNGGWDLLGTSRYLDDRPQAALEAWNRVGRPAVDLVRVEGVRRTRHPVVAARVGLAPRAVLTPESSRLAARRLAELPSAALTRLRYRPVDGGLAEIEAAVVERPTVPRGALPLLATAARSWLRQELRFDVAAPTGSGELWTVGWRWWESRPRVVFTLAVPSPSWLPGVATIEGSWERASYAGPRSETPADTAILRPDRRRAAFSLADWATSRIRWEAGAALDAWAGRRYLSAGAALETRLADDRLSIGVDASAWTPVAGRRGFATLQVSSAWRSTRDRGQPFLSVDAGAAGASANAPLDLWPGAGTRARTRPLLRAHPLLDRGVVNGPAFGRALAHLTLEYQHPVLERPEGTLRLATFVDTARAWHRANGGARSPVYADVGAGVRLALGGGGGSLRLDIARALRDGGTVLSAGWEPAWGHRRRRP